MLIADLAAASADHIKDFLLILGGLLALIALGKRVLLSKPEPREITPQPLAITTAPQYMPRHEAAAQITGLEARVLRMETAVENLRLEMRADRVASDQSSEARSTQLHKRIDDLATEVSHRLTDMPSQIIATLRNAGVIRT